MTQNSRLTTNDIAFIGLCSEYCAAIESAGETMREDFIESMLKLLPRIYIAASAIDVTPMVEDFYLDSALEEDYYDSVRRSIEALMGSDDTYLEVFEEDMKYSDSPIGASVAEGLSDIFQVFYNFLATVRNAPDSIVDEALAAIAGDFGPYWGQTVCNLMRPLHNIRYQSVSDDF